MNSKEYIRDAVVTESRDFDSMNTRLNDDGLKRLLHAGIGLSTEAGEFLDALKKHIFYGKELDRVNLKEEIKAGKVETINETFVGIQVKLINNENTQYVVGSGRGTASTVGKGFLMNPNMAWNQSSLSSASNKAMETAVVNVIKAIDRRGW